MQNGSNNKFEVAVIRNAIQSPPCKFGATTRTPLHLIPPAFKFKVGATTNTTNTITCFHFSTNNTKNTNSIKNNNISSKINSNNNNNEKQ